MGCDTNLPAGIGPGVLARQRGTGRPRASWPPIPSKAGVCSATASCSSTTRGSWYWPLPSRFPAMAPHYRGRRERRMV